MKTAKPRRIADTQRYIVGQFSEIGWYVEDTLGARSHFVQVIVAEDLTHSEACVLARQLNKLDKDDKHDKDCQISDNWKSCKACIASGLN